MHPDLRTLNLELPGRSVSSAVDGRLKRLIKVKAFRVSGGLRFKHFVQQCSGFSNAQGACWTTSGFGFLGWEPEFLFCSMLCFWLNSVG